MSVLKNNRSLSNLEFYNNAQKLRIEITNFLLRDFGVRDKVRRAKDDPEVPIIEEYPDWLITFFRQSIITLLRSLMQNITAANTIYPVTMSELAERRKYQTLAIINCEQLLADKMLIANHHRLLIHDNGASLKGKGVHFALSRLIAHLSRYYRQYKTNAGYCLTVDFSRYFDNIRHDILLESCAKYIRDPRILKLLHDFITPFGTGLGLGSQISRIAAVFYANPVDHFIKEKCRIRYYGRYMDDLYLIHPDKEYLRKCLEGIHAECAKLGISINARKTRITKLQNGVHFLKGIYSIAPNGKIIRRSTQESHKRMRRKLLKFKGLLDAGRMTHSDIYAAYQSWRNNYRKRFNAYHTIQRMDSLYNRLFSIENEEAYYGKKRVFVDGRRKRHHPHGFDRSR